MSVLMKDFAENKGEDLALVDDNGSINWKDLDRRINCLVHGFRQAGLQQGDYEIRIFQDGYYSQAGVYLFSVIDSSSTDISYNINEFLTDNFKI